MRSRARDRASLQGIGLTMAGACRRVIISVPPIPAATSATVPAANHHGERATGGGPALITPVAPVVSALGWATRSAGACRAARIGTTSRGADSTGAPASA